MRLLALWTVFLIVGAGSSTAGQPPPSLPRAEDVLPAGEVSRGSLVVTGDGFRFQVTPDYKPVAHPRSRFAYRATIQGILGPAEVTLYATRETFSGSLAALVARETSRVSAKGGKLFMSTPVKLHIAGRLQDAHRFYTTVDGVVDLHVMAVHSGQAFIFHGETPAVRNAWQNAGPDLMVRGSTFHVAPRPGIGDAQTIRPPAKTSSDICEIGDIERMSLSSDVTIDFAGRWMLDLSRSEGLPAMWRNATSATLVVAQDVELLTPVLTVVDRNGSMPYGAASYRLDGRTLYATGGARGQTRIASDLRYPNGGRVIVLRSTERVLIKDLDLPKEARSKDPAEEKDVELVHETTQRWELADGGRSLHVCRILKGPLTRTVSKLLFVRK